MPSFGRKDRRVNLLHRHIKAFAATALLLGLFAMARLPEAPAHERQRLSAQFRFERTDLPALPGAVQRTSRDVHPSLDHIRAWISAVGAAVALNDLDGDQIDNDLCYVDVRTDQVLVAPVPGTGDRYALHALDPAPLPYDAETTAPMGCLPGDANEDGRTDLLVYYWGRTPLLFIRENEGWRAQEVVPEGGRWFTNAATFADVDGDGHADVIVGNYFPDGSRILDKQAPGDESMQASMSRARNGGLNRVLLWAGPGRFREDPHALDPRTATAWTLAIAAADLDGDLLPEVYFANDFGHDTLLHNRSQRGQVRLAPLAGKRSLTTPSSKVLGNDSFKGMGADFVDWNGDGVPDLYVSNIASEYALEESHFLFVSDGDTASMRNGVAPYRDRSEGLGLSRSGWGWDSRLADFNNDGKLEALQATGFMRGRTNRWPELHEIAMGNDQLLPKSRSWHNFQPGEDDLSGGDANPFFVQASDGRYYDLAREIGIEDHQVSRGIAIADVDADGRLDYAVAKQWTDSSFYHNRSVRTGRFLSLRLLNASGSPAVGAFASVELPGGRRLTGQVDGGSGHSGKRSPEIHFGLGTIPDDTILSIHIRWRDKHGAVGEKHTRLRPGRHLLRLEEQL